jgi:transcription initiation factor TFIIE subunit alpha
MHTVLRDNVRTDSEFLAYSCTYCGKQFNAMDVLSLVNASDCLFHCDLCEYEITLNDNTRKVEESQDRWNIFNNQFQVIISLLKKIESSVVPEDNHKMSKNNRKDGNILLIFILLDN